MVRRSVTRPWAVPLLAGWLGIALALPPGAPAAAAGDDGVIPCRVSLGTVTAWGGNFQAQLGRGTIGGDDPRPMLVPGLAGVRGIAANGTNGFALRDDGTVWGWGGRSTGDLGLPAAGISATPVRIAGLDDIVSISAGYPNLALRRDGTVWIWGQGRRVELDHPVPVRKHGLPRNVVSVAAGNSYGLALLADGRVLAWGDNSAGQLGNGTRVNRSSPAPVPGLPPIRAVSAAQYSGYAVARDGTLWSWGFNGMGELGRGSKAVFLLRPGRVVGLTDGVQIAPGEDHALAVRRDGTVWAWGSNWYGDLGDGTMSSSTRPVRVRLPGRAVSVGASWMHSLALRADGTVWAWGANDNGQVGPGGSTAFNYPIPTRVQQVTGMSAIAVGGFHNMALRAADPTCQ